MSDLSACHAQAGKIKARHLERDAYVSVRQSTLTQVKQNREREARPSQLAEGVEELAWPREKIHVAYDHLGVSGARAQERKGFPRIVPAGLQRPARVAASAERSRRARDHVDPFRLVDLCAHLGVGPADD